MSIKAIIFDFDGVITESMDIKKKAFAYLFRDYPQDIIDKVVKLHLDNGGMSRYKKFQIIYQEFLNKKLSKEKEKKLGEEFSKFCFEKMLSCPYVNGVVDFLENYYKKYMFFVASGTPHKEMNDIVDKRNLCKYFKEVYGSPKSKTEIINEIVSKYNLSKSEVVFIGDAPNDYIGAKNANIEFVARIPKGRYNPFNSDEFNIEYSINDFTEFEDCLKEINN